MELILLEKTSLFVRAEPLCHSLVKFELVNEGLNGPHVRVSGRSYEDFGVAVTNLQPLLFVPVKLVSGELASSTVSSIVAVNLSMALKTNRNGIVDRIRSALLDRHYMISLYLDAAKPMANAASTVTLRQQPLDICSREGHRSTDALRNCTGRDPASRLAFVRVNAPNGSGGDCHEVPLVPCSP
jgi:hypothetical protein